MKGQQLIPFKDTGKRDAWWRIYKDDPEIVDDTIHIYDQPNPTDCLLNEIKKINNLPVSWCSVQHKTCVYDDPYECDFHLEMNSQEASPEPPQG